MALNQLQSEIVAKVVKNCPEFFMLDSYNESLSVVQSKLDLNIRLDANLTSQLLFVWLAHKKDMLIPNLETEQ